MSSRSLLPLALLAVAAPLAAQVPIPGSQQPGAGRAPTGVIAVGGSFDVSSPRGDFARNTDNGIGFTGTGLFRLDPEAIVNVRLDLGMVQYARAERRIPLSPSTGFFSVKLKTSSSIFSMVAGPQLLGVKGPFTPYATLLGGFSVFSTTSSLEDADGTGETFASETVEDDAVWAYGGAVGTYIRVHNGRYPVRVDLNARYLRHSEASYLTEDEIKAAINEDRAAVPVRSRADFVTFRLGVNVVVF